MSDTKNELTDFDFCIALGEAAINSQMAAAWKAWKKRGDFLDTVSLFKTRKGKQIVDSKTGLTATVAPLEISLAVPDGKLAQAGVTLRLTSGAVTYFDEESEQYLEEAVRDWSFSFVTDLDRRPVDRAALAIIDPEAEKTVTKVMTDATQIPDDAFSIEYLFLQLSSVDLMLISDRQVRIPDDVPTAAANRAKMALNLLFSGDLGNYPLGTVVRRNTKKPTPTFAVTDFLMHVRADKAVPRASTLAYLGMFAGRPLPADPNAARIKLSDAWVAPDRLDGTTALVSGVMAISRSVLLEKYLIPKFEAALGVSASKKGPMKWTFSKSTSSVNEMTDLLRIRFEKTDEWELTLEAGVGSNALAMSGQVRSKVLMDGYSLIDLNPFDDDSNTTVMYIHARGHKDFKGRLSFVGNGGEADFRLVPSITGPTFDNLVVDESDTGGLSWLSDAVEGLFKKVGFIGSTMRESLQNSMESTVNGLGEKVTNWVSGIQVDLTEHAFVPPGGGVYAISNPRFSAAGDMLLDVIYKAPRATNPKGA